MAAPGPAPQMDVAAPHLLLQMNAPRTVWWERGGIKHESQEHHELPLHRICGPAYIDVNFTCFAVNERTHRIDGPAIMGPSGGFQWLMCGVFHRIEGPFENIANAINWAVAGVTFDTTPRPWQRRARRLRWMLPFCGH